MNAFVTAGPLDGSLPPAAAAPSAADQAPAAAVSTQPPAARSWLRQGVAERAVGGALAAGCLWLLIAWAMATPGVA
jgi:hypothetical protein